MYKHTRAYHCISYVISHSTVTSITLIFCTLIIFKIELTVLEQNFDPSYLLVEITLNYFLACV